MRFDVVVSPFIYISRFRGAECNERATRAQQQEDELKKTIMVHHKLGHKCKLWPTQRDTLDTRVKPSPSQPLRLQPRHQQTIIVCAHKTRANDVLLYVFCVYNDVCATYLVYHLCNNDHLVSLANVFANCAKRGERTSLTRARAHFGENIVMFGGAANVRQFGRASRENSRAFQQKPNFARPANAKKMR